GNGSAYYAPAASLTVMAEAVLKDQRRVIPAIAYLEGEYGYSDIYLGVPTVLGGNGIEKIIELDLTDEEKAALDKSADSVKSVLNILKYVLKTLFYMLRCKKEFFIWLFSQISEFRLITPPKKMLFLPQKLETTK